MVKVEMLYPQGYCAGVKNAIAIAKDTKEKNPTDNVYIVGYLVHNKEVVSYLENLGIITLHEPNGNYEEIIKNLPENSIVIFPAHGHDEKYDEIAKNSNVRFYDAVCPKVRQNANIIKKEIGEKHQVIYIGISKHPETSASLSIDKDVILYDIHEEFDYSLIKDASPLVINQTTLNFEELKKIHSVIKEHILEARIQDEICNSTRMRQERIANLPHDVDLIVIVGDTASSNTNRLLEIARKTQPQAESYLVSNVGQLNTVNVSNKKHIVISSGASTPSDTINMIYEYLVNCFSK